MTIHFSFLATLLFFGITLGIFTAFILSVSKVNKKANHYLTFLVLICVGALAHNLLLETQIYEQYPNLYFLPVILSLGIGPLLFLYIRFLINNQAISRVKVILHLSPMVLQFAVYLFCFLQTPEVKYSIWLHWYEPIIKPIQIIGVYISVSFYIYWSFKIVATYKAKLNYFYSNSEKIALNWLQQLLYVFLAYYILALFFMLISYTFKLKTDYFPSDLIRCAIIFIIAVFAIRQNSLVPIQQDLKTLAIDNLEVPSITENEKETLGINTLDIKVDENLVKTKEVNRFLLDQIVSMVESQQLYLNPDLTIADIAAQLNMSTKTISYTINTGLQKSFALFINTYRVNLFKEKLISNQYQHLSLLGLAFECGFNSKSSFNRIFKEITGHVPKASYN